MAVLRKGLIFATTIITMMALPFTQTSVMAMEGGTEAIGSVMLPTIKEQIISVDLPTVGDESPFDFYIDPQGLLYDTGAVRHGGGVVEEGAYLLFHNHDDSDYDFSRYSDRLSVTNRSTVPVNVKITARISDLGDLRMDQDGNFDGEDDAAIYLAIVDDEGNEQVLSEDGEVSVEIELSRAPSEAYTYRYDESSDSYEYVYQEGEGISFDSYSFGLRGECNANADWRGISAYPRVMVTWSVNPIYPEYERDYEDTEKETDEAENIAEDDANTTIEEEQKSESEDASESTDTEKTESQESVENNEATEGLTDEGTVTPSSDTDDKESETKIESEDHGAKAPKSEDATGELDNDESSDSDETDETEKHTAEGGQV